MFLLLIVLVLLLFAAALGSIDNPYEENPTIEWVLVIGLVVLAFSSLYES